VIPDSFTPPLRSSRSIGIASLSALAIALPEVSIWQVVAMRSGAAEPDPDARFDAGATPTRDLAVGVTQLLADAMMSIAGPLFWAALALGLITDMLGPDVLR